MLSLLTLHPDDDGDFGNMQDGAAEGGDFLSRERAALGDDADLFTSSGDVPSVSVQNGDDDDLLGGGQTNGTNDDMNQFQRSFPAVDTRNDVRLAIPRT